MACVFCIVFYLFGADSEALFTFSARMLTHDRLLCFAYALRATCCLFVCPLTVVGQTSALFSAAKKAEVLQSQHLLAVEDDRNKVTKAGFFMLCALGTADVSRVSIFLSSVLLAFTPLCAVPLLDVGDEIDLLGLDSGGSPSWRATALVLALLASGMTPAKCPSPSASE